jgi:hypothetical protein
MARYYNDGSSDRPKLRSFINLDGLNALRPGSLWPSGLDPLHDGRGRDERLAADGFEGVQLTTDAPPAPGSFLPHCGLGRINEPADADPLAARRADRGDLCCTVHVGWGDEDDDEVYRLVEAVLQASQRRRLPIFIETHRATIAQDAWRTVQITRRFPEVLFNGDFSHLYCGQEMIYGDWSRRVAFLQPIFDRVAFMHGRVASSSCMQVPVGPDLSRRPLQAHGEADYLAHFRDLWTAALGGFRRAAGAGDVLIFAPELLAGTYYYARLFPDASGQLVEETDRYAEAILLRQLAMQCWDAAAPA